MSQHASEFCNHLLSFGIPIDDPLEFDGKLHRYKTPGDHQENCWYVLRENSGILCANFGCWKRNFTERWSSREWTTLTGKERSDVQSAWKAADQARRSEEAQSQLLVKKRASDILLRSVSAGGDHPYLKDKEVKPTPGLKTATDEAFDGWIFLPLQDEKGVVWSAQFIAGDGTKRFLYQGRVAGCYYELSSLPATPLVICEGWATGASIYEATGWSVVCAMNCGNLMAVSKALRKSNPDRLIVIASDNDQFTEGNPGLIKAKEAAEAIKGQLAIPQFNEDVLDHKPTDFNDLHWYSGLESVKNQILSSCPVHATAIGMLQASPENDPTELLKHRFLCQAGSLMITGPTGMGKSSFVMQCLALWANGLDCFGITPARPLTSVLIQAENDDGDLAEMRDGVARGLNFTVEQRRNFFERVLVFSSNGVTGMRFCSEVVSPILSLHRTDLAAIDPAFAFLGADSKDAKAVGEWLRAGLNPILARHRSACLMIHHTNKPATGKDKPEWRNGEMAYTGSGSVEWANWARGIISLQSTGTPGVYKIHASKRGSRLGWKDSDDQTQYEKIIAHAKEKGVICWRESDNSEVRDNSSSSRGPSWSPTEIADLLSDRSLSSVEFAKSAREELGLSEATFYRHLKELQSSGRILKSKINKKWALIHKPDDSELPC